MNMGIHGVVFERSVTLKWFTSVALSPKQPNTAEYSAKKHFTLLETIQKYYFALQSKKFVIRQHHQRKICIFLAFQARLKYDGNIVSQYISKVM